MARDTVSVIVERIRRQLDSTVRLEINLLAANVNATATTLTFQYELADSLRAGSTISIGSELMRVVSVAEVPKQATVIRGWQDSTAEAHLAGDEALVNPRFTRFDILDAIINEIDSWSPDLFDVRSHEFDTTDEMEVYELPVDLAASIGLVGLRINRDARSSDSWPKTKYRLQRGSVADWSAASKSGLLIRFAESIGRAGDGKALALVAIPYDTTTIDEDTDLTSLNIPRTLLELIEIGVKMRLLGDDENNRSSRRAQDEPRRTDEVPPETAGRRALTLEARYNARRGHEVQRFRTLYPMSVW